MSAGGRAYRASWVGLQAITSEKTPEESSRTKLKRKKEGGGLIKNFRVEKRGAPDDKSGKPLRTKMRETAALRKEDQAVKSREGPRRAGSKGHGAEVRDDRRERGNDVRGYVQKQEVARTVRRGEHSKRQNTQNWSGPSWTYEMLAKEY